MPRRTDAVYFKPKAVQVTRVESELTCRGSPVSLVGIQCLLDQATLEVLGGGFELGVETLVRWKHPSDGLVLPEQFIPTAEAEVLIRDLTKVVLKEAIRQARLWHDQGLDLNVALNVSMEDLTDSAFSDFAIDQAYPST